jgi:hypothetical protein
MDRESNWLSPGKLISAIQHSSLVITDSYHATTLSLSLNRPVITLTSPGIDPNIETLEKTFGVNLLHNTENKVESFIDNFHWDSINTHLSKQRFNQIGF